MTTTSTAIMGPQIPLNFFMTRLLFMDQAKVDSLKARNNRDVQIITDNPAILPESMAKSLPPIPFPPAAPESPKSVEGWKGLRVGGWLCIGGKISNVHPPTVPDLNGADASSSEARSSSATTTTTATATAEVAKLSLADDNDDTEMTEESNITSITEASASATATATTAAPTEKRRQLFPTNSKRNLRLSSNNSGNSSGGGSKRNLTKKGGSIKSITRPILKKRNSSKSKQVGATGDNNGSSPSNSGAEDN